MKLTWPAIINTNIESLPRHLDESLSESVNLPNREGIRDITVITIKVNSDVNIKNVPSLERPGVRNTMSGHIVDRGRNTLGKTIKV